MENTVWALIWFSAAAVFGVGEILVAGSFFLFPFAVGALGAAVTALFAPTLVSWAVFAALSTATFLGLRPLANRLERNAPSTLGVGANRLIGSHGTVVTPLPAGSGDAGLVQVGAEQWKAETRHGVVAAVGTKIRVVEVQGTRLVVEPVGIDDVVL